MLRVISHWLIFRWRSTAHHYGLVSLAFTELRSGILTVPQATYSVEADNKMGKGSKISAVRLELFSLESCKVRRDSIPTYLIQKKLFRSESSRFFSKSHMKINFGATSLTFYREPQVFCPEETAAEWVWVLFRIGPHCSSRRQPARRGSCFRKMFKRPAMNFLCFKKLVYRCIFKLVAATLNWFKWYQSYAMC